MSPQPNIIDANQFFKDLNNLCINPETGFYSVDQKDAENNVYRIFSYRLIGSYANFLLPNAMNCRGTMFVNDDGDWKLSCLPMKKFFRLNENPITMNLDIDHQDWEIEEKLDGSLISSFIKPDGSWDVKSKTSINSDHAKFARSLLASVDYSDLRDFITEQAKLFRTVS